MIKDYRYYAAALGVNMMWNPYPVVSIFRDAIGLGGGTAFTAGYMLLGFFLMMPINIFQRMYSPNKPLAMVGFSLMALMLVYMQYYQGLHFNYYVERYTEWSYFAYCIMFFVAILYFPNEHTDKIILVTIPYTMFGNLGLIYAIATDPNWTVGVRAAIKFKSGTPSNPHNFAYSAIYGLLASCIFPMLTRNNLIKIGCYLSAIVNVVILLLCLSASSMLSVVMMACIFAVLNWSKIMEFIKKPIVFRVLAVFFMGLVYFFSRNQRLWGQVTFLVESFSGRFLNLFLAATGTIKSGQMDMSSRGRVESFGLAVKIFQENSLFRSLVGNGYKAEYFDIPVVESFTDFGITGFALHVLFLLLLFLTCFMQMLRPANGFSLFLAYGVCLIMVTSFTSGRPTSLFFWLSYAVYMRFIGVDYYKKQEPSLFTS
jgi:hypothetical protein